MDDPIVAFEREMSPLINDGAIYCFTHWLLDNLSRPASKQAADVSVDRSRSKCLSSVGKLTLLLPRSTRRFRLLLPDQLTCSGFESEAGNEIHCTTWPPPTRPSPVFRCRMSRFMLTKRGQATACGPETRIFQGPHFKQSIISMYFLCFLSKGLKIRTNLFCFL